MVLLIFSCTPERSDSGIDEQALPEILGEGIISTELPEFATSFSPDGNTIFFNRTSEDRSKLQIMMASKSGGKWSRPEAMAFSDGTYFDVDPFVTSDGTRMYFSSNRPTDGDESKDFDTWYVQKEDEGWSEPINAGQPINGVESEVFVSFTKDRTLYFSISTEGVRRIYRSEFVDGSHQAPQKVFLPVADSVGVGNPLIDPDERFLMFTSSQLDGMGGADIFIADHEGNGVFSNIRNAGESVNSPYADFAPGFSADGTTLYFTSERPGIVGALEQGRPPGDIYSINLEALILPNRP